MLLGDGGGLAAHFGLRATSFFGRVFCLCVGVLVSIAVEVFLDLDLPWGWIVVFPSSVS